MKVRVTGILQNDTQILVLDQDVDNNRSWSLPGGTLEDRETLEVALIREMREETGLDVRVKELLYICDFIQDETHVVHITFRVEQTGGTIGDTIKGLDTNEIRGVSFVSVDDLTQCGFSEKFQQIVIDGFPDKGSYMGPKSNIGL